MRMFLFAAMIFVLMIGSAGCAAQDLPVEDPNRPVGSEGPGEVPVVTSPPDGSTPQPTAPADLATDPKPGDDALTRGPVFLDSKEMLTLESFPPQFMLHLTGNTPTPCHTLRVKINPADAEGKIEVEVYSLVRPDVMCAQVLAPFDVSVPVKVDPGRYTLSVNGDKVAEFEMPQAQ